MQNEFPLVLNRIKQALFIKKLPTFAIKMKTLALGIVCVFSSWLIMYFSSESRYLFIETTDLATLYENPDKTAAQLDNGYPEADLDQTKALIKKYKLSATGTIQYLFEVTDLMRKFENNELSLNNIPVQGFVYQRFFESRDNNIHIDCGRFTDFISVFMMAKDIPFRRIDAHYIPDTAIGAHSFQEIYVKEKNQWAFVDITNDKILLTFENGDFVTVKDVYERISENDYTGIGVYSYAKQNTQPLPWKENIVEEDKCFVPSIMLLYYHQSLEKAYNGIGKLKRQFFFTDWITHFNPPQKHENALYYTRVLLLYLGVLLLLFWTIQLIINRS